MEPAELLTSVLAVNITLAVMFAGVSLWRSDILLAWTSCRALAVCLVVKMVVVEKNIQMILIQSRF